MKQGNKVILHLNLIRKWYDLVLSGDKKEEYREFKKMFVKMFYNNTVLGKILIKGQYYEPKDIIICFSNGYAKDRDQFFIEFLGISIGTGRSEWGANPGEQYFVIKLGEIIHSQWD